MTPLQLLIGSPYVLIKLESLEDNDDLNVGVEYGNGLEKSPKTDLAAMLRDIADEIDPS